MKVDVLSLPVARTFVLTLNETEATALRSLSLAVHNQTENMGPVSQLVFDVYHVFAGKGIEASSDIFTDGYNPQVARGK